MRKADVSAFRAYLLALDALTTLLITLFTEPPHAMNPFNELRWGLAGAFSRVVHMLVIVIAMPRVGTAAAIEAAISG
ncbi:hypothetical protein KDX27_39220 [Burkholderia cenocepacia]|uniref:hypothetical protein n=1 Tax=Burkholderia cepacia complex TaxID=87882 RepID=UPI001B99D7E7|nr:MULTISPECIES: hypothetical protein [Burkholderia cepacia complex]MBR8173724.1 hypothetical protein [Burkholderia cenocepacia]MCO8320380.1 hypothetical protein [Burkholderia multivorans]